MTDDVRRIVRVIRGYEAAYHGELRLRPGDIVTVGDGDDHWPAFRWCTGESGASGWVPENYLEIKGETGTAMREYDTTELTVEAGERLEVFGEVGGWLRCRRATGDEGWLPAENTAPDEPAESS
jgi:Variant SH3 domain